MGDFQARGEGAGHAGDPEEPGKWGVLGDKEGEGCTGNEEETMNPTTEPRTVFSCRCKLILRTGPREGPRDLEL